MTKRAIGHRFSFSMWTDYDPKNKETWPREGERVLIEVRAMNWVTGTGWRFYAYPFKGAFRLALYQKLISKNLVVKWIYAPEEYPQEVKDAV